MSIFLLVVFVGRGTECFFRKKRGHKNGGVAFGSKDCHVTLPYGTLLQAFHFKRPRLVWVGKAYRPSHRMFGHMYGVLNIDYL